MIGSEFDFQLYPIYNLSVCQIKSAKSLNQLINIKSTALSRRMFSNNKIGCPIRYDAPQCSDSKLQDYLPQEIEMKTPKKQNVIQRPELMEIETECKEYFHYCDDKSDFEKHDKNIDYIPLKKSFLDFRKIEHVRINRGRLIDWFVEVCKVYHQTWKTLWIAISILDTMIIKKGKINVENIHLFGSTALFIASKYNESYDRLTLDALQKKITHGKFSRKQIMDCESSIFQWIWLSNNRTMSSPTIEDMVLDCFPKISQEDIKRIMIEILYFWQNPTWKEIQNEQMTEKDLVKIIGNNILCGQRYEPSCQNELEFLNEYGCTNIKMYAKDLKL